MLLCLGWYYWRRGWDSFSPAQAKKQSTGLFFFAPCSSLLLRSRPPSLAFARLVLPPLVALNSASSPLLCLPISFTQYASRTTQYELMADAVATTSNRRRNNRPYQNTPCFPTLFISKIIQESNPTAPARNELWRNSEKPKHQ